jgi:hypothetical protein
MTIYAVYKDETFLCEGTSKQCAEYMGVKPETIRFWSSKAYKRRIAGLTEKFKKKRNCIVAIVLDFKEE